MSPEEKAQQEARIARTQAAEAAKTQREMERKMVRSNDALEMPPWIGPVMSNLPTNTMSRVN